MGLDINIKGLSIKETYHGGYSRFNNYRWKLAEAYNKRLGELYKKSILGDISGKEVEEWNNLCNDDLDIFLWHSDCDGKITPKECKKIYNAMKDLKLETSSLIEIHNLWLNMFKHCYKRGVNMYFY